MGGARWGYLITRVPRDVAYIERSSFPPKDPCQLQKILRFFAFLAVQNASAKCISRISSKKLVTKLFTCRIKLLKTYEYYVGLPPMANLFSLGGLVHHFFFSQLLNCGDDMGESTIERNILDMIYIFVKQINWGIWNDLSFWQNLLVTPVKTTFLISTVWGGAIFEKCGLLTPSLNNVSLKHLSESLKWYHE